MPEKLITQKSSHKTLKGLHLYEHTSDKQEKAAGEVIGKTGKQFGEVIASSTTTKAESEEEKADVLVKVPLQ